MTTQDKINTIKSNLQDAEDTDFQYMSEPVKDLRHYVLYIHSSLEASLEIRIINHIKKQLPFTPQHTQEKVNFAHNMRVILNEMDFSKKIKIAQNQGSIPVNIVGKLHAVNDIRVYFSHPTTYMNKLIEYKDDNKELEAYEILDVAHQAMNGLILKENPQWIKK